MSKAVLLLIGFCLVMACGLQPSMDHQESELLTQLQDQIEWKFQIKNRTPYKLSVQDYQAEENTFFYFDQKNPNEFYLATLSKNQNQAGGGIKFTLSSQKDGSYSGYFYLYGGKIGLSSVDFNSAKAAAEPEQTSLSLKNKRINVYASLTDFKGEIMIEE